MDYLILKCNEGTIVPEIIAIYKSQKDFLDRFKKELAYFVNQFDKDASVNLIYPFEGLQESLDNSKVISVVEDKNNNDNFLMGYSDKNNNVLFALVFDGGVDVTFFIEGKNSKNEINKKENNVFLKNPS